MYRQSKKKLVEQQYLLHMSPKYGELWPTSGWDWSGSLRYRCKFQLVSRIGSVTAWHLVVGVSQTAALNRGRHLRSAGWPSRWALAHILVTLSITVLHGRFSWLPVSLLEHRTQRSHVTSPLVRWCWRGRWDQEQTRCVEQTTSECYYWTRTPPAAYTTTSLISAVTEITRHTASTGMYSLTFRARTTTPPQYGRNGTAHAAGAPMLSPARGVFDGMRSVRVRRAVGLADYRWALPCISIVLP